MSAEEPWVQVVPYDVRWAESYRVESAAIGAALGDYVSGIEHFGSTAVPGLVAKPIVDILVGAEPGIEPHAAIERLSALGYEYLGEDGRRPGRHFWRKRGISNFNVSAVPHLGALWASNLAVRDFLRTHPEWVERYGRIKLAAAAVAGTSMLEYQIHKREFVDQLRAATLAWAADSS
ncbi:GrpB family protein [Mycolicibacterium litorale]|uniref:GrpB family protein n=1 Tax=Mycolicibacterium litorale TaxID=758802 RepID=UPI003CF67117